MLNIRLARTGRKRDAHFRVVVSDARHGRVGRIVETVGYYHPRMANDAEGRLHLDGDRARYWLGRGARPSPTVRSFLRRMQQEPAPEATADSDAPAPESLPESLPAAPAESPTSPETPTGTPAPAETPPTVSSAAPPTPTAPPPAG